MNFTGSCGQVPTLAYSDGCSLFPMLFRCRSYTNVHACIHMFSIKQCAAIGCGFVESPLSINIFNLSNLAGVYLNSRVWYARGLRLCTAHLAELLMKQWQLRRSLCHSSRAPKQLRSVRNSRTSNYIGFYLNITIIRQRQQLSIEPVTLCLPRSHRCDRGGIASEKWLHHDLAVLLIELLSRFRRCLVWLLVASAPRRMLECLLVRSVNTPLSHLCLIPQNPRRSLL